MRLPIPPVGRVDVEPFLRFGIDPCMIDAPACEHERMRAAVVEHRQLKIAVERRGGNDLPHHFLDKAGKAAAP